jgi:mannose-6-phosphate isomerase-like protein (cupin superfamily)
MWRKLGEDKEIDQLGPSTSLTIQTGIYFQFRCHGPVPLVALGATVPPWPSQPRRMAFRERWEATI